MLVATRDPFHDGAHKASSHRHDAPGGPPSGGRFMSVLQVTGALLAIPVGLASAYTMYRANFSVETSCQSLRAGIIATLDKNVDAATRRMLVRRDVQTFEQTCAAFDPDATVAFKTLLAADKTAAVPARVEAPPKETARKVDNKADTKSEPRSDTKWLEAVRGALVDHAEPPAAAVVAPVASAPPAVIVVPAAAPAPVAAPALPPATLVPAALPVAAAPVAKPDADHPVPPESIPGAPPLSLEPKKAETSNRSRLGELIADIPLLGRVIEPKGN